MSAWNMGERIEFKSQILYSTKGQDSIINLKFKENFTVCH